MKEINSTLKSKLRNYSILAGSAMAAATPADGQIMYHDINPDVVLSKNTDSLFLDLNGDALSDFEFQEIKRANTTAAYFQFARTNDSIGGSVTSSTGTQGTINKFGQPYVFGNGQKIGASGKWFNFSDIKTASNAFYRPYLALSFSGSAFGNWGVGDTAKFIALRIKSGSQFNYGWVRCTVPRGGTSMTILDYAYQTIPDSSIIAGDTGEITGIATHPLQNVSVWSSGKNVFVRYPDARNGMTIIVRDMLGKEVAALQTTNELYEINLGNSAAGVYTVTVRSKEAEMTKKVSIQ